MSIKVEWPIGTLVEILSGDMTGERRTVVGYGDSTGRYGMLDLSGYGEHYAHPSMVKAVGRVSEETSDTVTYSVILTNTSSGMTQTIEAGNETEAFLVSDVLKVLGTTTIVKTSRTVTTKIVEEIL